LADSQIYRIQVRRGLNENLPTLLEGEFGFATDTKDVYIGTGTENINIANYEDLENSGGTGTIPEGFQNEVMNRLMTQEERDKLTGIEDGAEVNTVFSVNGQTGEITIQTFSGDYNDLTNTPTIPRSPSDIGASPSNHTHDELHTHSNKSLLDKLMQTGGESSFNLSDFVTGTDLGEAGYGDMTKVTYDSNDDGVVNKADDSDTLQGHVPSDFASSSHTHEELHTHSNKTVLDSLADSNGQLQYNGSDIGNVTSVNGQTGSVTVEEFSGDYTDLTNRPSIPNSPSDIGAASDTHIHSISDVTNLQTELNGKSDDTHIHSISDVTNLQTELNGKSDDTHTHDYSEINNTPYIPNSASDVGASPEGHIHSYDEITNKPNLFSMSVSETQPTDGTDIWYQVISESNDLPL